MCFCMYRIQPNYRPCPHNPPPPPRLFFTLFPLIITDLTIFVLTFYFIFTYYRPLDDLLALVVENNFKRPGRLLGRIRYSCIFININRQEFHLIWIHLHWYVSTSIYFCVDPDVTALIWIAYN